MKKLLPKGYRWKKRRDGSHTDPTWRVLGLRRNRLTGGPCKKMGVVGVLGPRPVVSNPCSPLTSW